MGVFDRLRGIFNPELDTDAIQDEGPKRVVVSLHPHGGSGTSIHGGFYDEEYLTELLDTEGADQFDKMRRNDARVKMSIGAVQNPIRSANWEVSVGGEKTDFDKQMRDFIEFQLFEGQENLTWTGFLTEALSMPIFGHSIFEIVNQLRLNDPKFGTHIALRKLAFRSQRTIDRWHLDTMGNILSIQQLASGDVGGFVEIPGKFLCVFPIDKEGDNWQGISMLRSAYGPWKRKQNFLKLNAIGVERFAIPTPVGTTPAGTANSNENDKFLDVIEKYVTHQSNSVVLPEGWVIDLKSNAYDPEKVLKAIEFENSEIVSSVGANFLNLGQANSGGSYALSNDLSDFFLSGIEYIASLICEGINQKVIPQLIRLNFGPQESLPFLAHSGISDKAGKELAEIIAILAKTKAIIPDDQLETHLRSRYNLPEVSEDGKREVNPEPAQATLGGIHHKRDIKLALDSKTEKTARGLIVSRTPDVKELMQKHLGPMGTNLVNSIMRKYQRLTPSQRRNATAGQKAKGTQEYQSELKEILTEIAFDALAQARRETPGGSQVELADPKHFKDLPKDTQALVTSQAQNFAKTHADDLEKAVFFQFDSSFGSTEDANVLRQDLQDNADKFTTGPATNTGSANTTALVVNETRNAFFFDDEVLKDIESFTFTNPNPKSAICKNLTGKTFSSDDPEAGRFFPPLHHNCKSYLVPNFSGKTSKDISGTGLRPTGSDAEVTAALKSISLSEDDKQRSVSYSGDDELKQLQAQTQGQAHTHLDAEGRETGPSRAMPDQTHDHEKDTGGRVDSAPNTPDHVHKDGNNGVTGPPIIKDEPGGEPAGNIQLQDLEMHKIVVSKDMAPTLMDAQTQAEKFGEIGSIEETPDFFFFIQRPLTDFVEGSLSKMKVAPGVALVMGILRA